MTVPLIDVLETIDVDHDHGDFATCLLMGFHRILEMYPVPQSGQRIEKSELLGTTLSGVARDSRFRLATELNFMRTATSRIDPCPIHPMLSSAPVGRFEVAQWRNYSFA
jgi:hypothetical protein